MTSSSPGVTSAKAPASGSSSSQSVIRARSAAAPVVKGAPRPGVTRPLDRSLNPNTSRGAPSLSSASIQSRSAGVASVRARDSSTVPSPRSVSAMSCPPRGGGEV